MSRVLGIADKNIRSTKMFISVIASERVKFENTTRWNTRQVEAV